MFMQLLLQVTFITVHCVRERKASEWTVLRLICCFIWCAVFDVSHFIIFPSVCMHLGTQTSCSMSGKKYCSCLHSDIPCNEQQTLLHSDISYIEQQEITVLSAFRCSLHCAARNYCPVCIQIVLTLSSKKLLVLSAFRYSLHRAARNYWSCPHSDIP